MLRCPGERRNPQKNVEKPSFPTDFPVVLRGLPSSVACPAADRGHVWTQISNSADAERLELAMQRRALHADEFRGARDIARKAADLGDQVIAFEHFARLAQRQAHDV